MGEGVDLNRNGDLGQHGADERRALADQQATVRRDGERPDIERLAFETRPEA